MRLALNLHESGMREAKSGSAFPSLDENQRRGLFRASFFSCLMASHGQHPQDTSTPNRGGGGQTVVEMCDVTDSGIVFWSRHRFQIGSELQIRLRRDTLSPKLQVKLEPQGEWVMMHGFVVQCTQVRRQDGTVMFRVDMLFEAALASPQKKVRAKRCFVTPAPHVARPFSLN